MQRIPLRIRLVRRLRGGGATHLVSAAARFLLTASLVVLPVLPLLLPDPAAARSHRRAEAALGTIEVAALPPEGRATLAAIQAGGPFVSRRDGIVFGNREGRLPAEPRGYYAEYTVPTPGDRTRGARRIIAGRGTTGDVRTSGEYYYTDDHYQSFRRILVP